MKENLPNITGVVRSAGIEGVDAGGAFASDGKIGATFTHSGANGVYANSFTFNASRSSSTYQDNTPVRPLSITTPFLIKY